MIAGMLTTPVSLTAQVRRIVDGSCSCPVSVLTTAKPRPSASAASTGLTEVEVIDPQFPPQPSNRKRWFQTGGKLSRNSAEPGPQPVAHGPVVGHSPLVATAPITWQYSGTENVPAGSVTVDAGIIVADVTVTLGMLNVDATQAVSARTAEAPPRSAAAANVRASAKVLMGSSRLRLDKFRASHTRARSTAALG